MYVDGKPWYVDGNQIGKSTATLNLNLTIKMRPYTGRAAAVDKGDDVAARAATGTGSAPQEGVQRGSDGGGVMRAAAARAFSGEMQAASMGTAAVQQEGLCRALARGTQRADSGVAEHLEDAAATAPAAVAGDLKEGSCSGQAASASVWVRSLDANTGKVQSAWLPRERSFEDDNAGCGRASASRRCNANGSAGGLDADSEGTARQACCGTSVWYATTSSEAGRASCGVPILDPGRQQKAACSAHEGGSMRCGVAGRAAASSSSTPDGGGKDLFAQAALAGLRLKRLRTKPARLSLEVENEPADSALKLMAVRIGLERGPSNSWNIDGLLYWVPACLEIDGVHASGLLLMVFCLKSQ
ncbi:hypothetical protein K438DRAFT_1777086 [Mycena galopus ATCC 62051]|nr:hypothetical protein K438DRAFT_1777086 [Mycena galopus ATCC 62051]